MPLRIARIVPRLARALSLRLAPALLLLAVLAACEAVSYPFGSERATAPAALAEFVGPSVMVAPLAGPPAEVARAYADQVAAALTRSDVLASTRNPPPQSYLLSGHAYVAEAPDGSVLHMVWSLNDPRGMPAGTTEFDTNLPGLVAGTPLTALPEELRDALARRTADWVAERLYGRAAGASETVSPEAALWAKAAKAPPLPPLAASEEGPVPMIAALLRQARGGPAAAPAADPLAVAEQTDMSRAALTPKSGRPDGLAPARGRHLAMPVPKPPLVAPGGRTAAAKSEDALVLARERARAVVMP